MITTLLSAANTMLTAITLFATLYVVASVAAKYSMLGRYSWFSNLEDALMRRFPSKEIMIAKVFSFKLWHCETCLSFWISLILMSILSVTLVGEIDFIDVLSTSFIVYLFKQTRESYESTRND